MFQVVYNMIHQFSEDENGSSRLAFQYCTRKVNCRWITM